jgi:hypothetical protein
MESKKSNIPEPKITSEGKFQCTEDNQEYETREAYNDHCMKEHMKSSESSSKKW